MDHTFFTGNRRRLWEAVGGDDAVLVAFSGRARRRTADEDYDFYASRDFVYLTGLEQEDLVYLAWQRAGQFQEVLFLPETDAFHERWFGRMLRPEQARERSGIQTVEPRDRFEGRFRRLVGGMARPAVWLDFDLPGDGQAPEPAQVFARTVAEQWPWCALHNAHPALRRLRTVKRPEELAQLRESIALTDQGIRAMLAACRPGLYEYQLRAVFEQVLADRGFRVPAFPTIVAAGRNTLVMHYPEQDAQIRDGDLILVDLGAQCGCCGADISRVFPANGRFTERQKLLHAASVSTIDALCRRLGPGMPMSSIDRLTDELLFVRLKDMDLLERPEQVRDYRWHATSHHLGFDVHDDNDYALPMAPGMVFTLEVGVYVPQWGEGVRVEDDVLVTEAGCEDLSRSIPREVEEIEALMAAR